MQITRFATKQNYALSEINKPHRLISSDYENMPTHELLDLVGRDQMHQLGWGTESE